MAQLVRTGPTATVDGIGRTRHGVIHTVPDALVKDLLATGEWAEPNQAQEPQRVTEPAPAKPAAKPKASSKKR